MRVLLVTQAIPSRPASWLARNLFGDEMTTALTIERLRYLLHYDPVSGVFTRRVKSNRWKVGGVLGSVGGTGRVQFRVDGKNYLAHRLAWFYTYGTWPLGEIDHIDHDPLNNRISNLRDVTRSVNQQNRRCAPRHSSTGVLGVHKSGRGFSAAIKVQGAQVYLGWFNSAEQAYDVYIAAKRTHHKGNML